MEKYCVQKFKIQKFKFTFYYSNHITHDDSKDS